MKKIFLSLGLILLLAQRGRAVTPASQPATPSSRVGQTRRDFLKLIDRPRVPLAAEQSAMGIEKGLAKFHFAFFSEAAERVPGILLAQERILNDGQRHPVVILLHGTGGDKEAELPTLREMAVKGFIAVAIDARYHGERGNQAAYNAAIAQAFADGKSHPLYFDEVWDVMRLMDYLQSRADVDPARIGMMGISKGGIETWLTAAVDPRVAVAIPCISVQSFAWGLEHDGWHGRIGTVQKGFDLAAIANGINAPDAAFVRQFYDRVIPGIYSEYDCPQMLPLIAPRPLLVISGEKDPINPLEGMHLSDDATAPVYAKSGVADRFKVILEANAGHTVTKASRAAAAGWFEKYLGDPVAAK